MHCNFVKNGLSKLQKKYPWIWRYKDHLQQNKNKFTCWWHERAVSVWLSSFKNIFINLILDSDNMLIDWSISFRQFSWITQTINIKNYKNMTKLCSYVHIDYLTILNYFKISFVLISSKILRFRSNNSNFNSLHDSIQKMLKMCFAKFIEDH